MSRFMQAYIDDIDSLLESCIADTDRFVLMEADGDNPGSDKNLNIIERIFKFIGKVINKIVGIVKKIFLKIRRFFTGRSGSDFRVGGLYFLLDRKGCSAISAYNELMVGFYSVINAIHAVYRSGLQPYVAEMKMEELNTIYNEKIRKAEDRVRLNMDPGACTMVFRNTDDGWKYMDHMIALYDEEAKRTTTLGKDCIAKIMNDARLVRMVDVSVCPITVPEVCMTFHKYIQNITKMAIKDASTINNAIISAKRDTTNGNIKPASTHYYDGTGAHEILP